MAAAGSFTPTAVPCETDLSAAYGVSRDGQVVVGFARDGCALGHAFRWTASNGMVDLGSSVPRKRQFGFRCVRRRQCRRWVSGGGQRRPAGCALVERPPGTRSPASMALSDKRRATNVDGSIVVGRDCRPVLGNADQSAWVWTAQTGRSLPAPRRITVPGPGVGPPVSVEAKATSDDGQVIGGGQDVGGSSDSNAIVWIGGRPAYLKDLLQANGVPNAFDNWVEHGKDHGHDAGWPRSRRVGCRGAGLPRVHDGTSEGAW